MSESQASHSSDSYTTARGYYTDDTIGDAEDTEERISNPKYIIYLLRFVVLCKQQNYNFDYFFIFDIIHKLAIAAKHDVLYKTALTYLYLYLKGYRIPRELTMTTGIPYEDEHGVNRNVLQGYKDIDDEDLSVLDLKKINAIKARALLKGRPIPENLGLAIRGLFDSKGNYIKPSRQPAVAQPRASLPKPSAQRKTQSASFRKFVVAKPKTQRESLPKPSAAKPKTQRASFRKFVVAKPKTQSASFPKPLVAEHRITRSASRKFLVAKHYKTRSYKKPRRI